jgi:hypothetical protein
MTLTQIDNGKDVTFDDTLPILRNASVHWLWKALTKKELVQKVSDGKRIQMKLFYSQT